MFHRPSVAFALSTFALGACSSEEATSNAPSTTSQASTCAADLPKTISISEGGRFVLPRTDKLAQGDTTFTGRGVTVRAGSDVVAIRAPYAAEAEGELAVDVRCGESEPVAIPVVLRPLAWTRLAAWTDDGPPGREYGGWWIDPSGGLVVYGGFHYVPRQFTPSNDAWRFDFANNRWSPLAGTLPTLVGGRAAPIGTERAVYYFGGASVGEDGSLATSPSLLRIEYDENTIRPSPIATLGEAPGSYTGSLVYDSKRSRWLSVCGVDTSAGPPHCDVHAFAGNGSVTSVETTGPAPSGRFGFHYAYDIVNDRVVVFAGQEGQDNLAIAADTWALDLAQDPPRWTELFASDPSATRRRNGAFAFDPVGQRLFVWGGTPDGKASVKGLQVLSLDAGEERWTTVETDADPPARTSGLAEYDAKGQRIVAGFGNGGGSVYRDLWSLDVANGEITR